jgi:acetyl-CoA carboxylase, biotin carboxylase subunit
MFKRVLVANRGEIARRIIRTLNNMDIESVAIFSQADFDAPYLKEASDGICIGPAQAKTSYLCEDAILEAALQTECEALHPGFGFLSENARFAERCRQQKLSFIGPPSPIISLMGDKAKARETMANLGVKTLSGSKGIIHDLDELKHLANEIGYPILLKARAGGGGKGMRLVDHEEDLPKAFKEAQMEAHASFHDQELYVEKFVRNARHIEFQILADEYGNVVILGERECSIQRKNQKLLEECPANNISEQSRREIGNTLTSAMKTIGYVNAGTVEFLLDSEGKFYFMEMNTRIQVEHPVTELVFGLDIVEWQIRIACMEKLPWTTKDLVGSGVAIECRINAEDPKNNFQGSPGKIDELILPAHQDQGPVRIDTHIAQGFHITPFYDSLLAKVITHGSNRKAAIQLMKKTLDEMKIKGIATTIDFQKAILQNDDFAEGHYTCAFLENHWSDLLASMNRG